MASDTTNGFDKFIDKVGNHRLVAVALVVGSMVIALATFTNSLQDIAAFVFPGQSLYRGHVRSADGFPLATAKVSIPGATVEPVYTDSEGEFVIAWPSRSRPQVIRVEIQADGYQRYSRHVERAESIPAIFVLERVLSGALVSEVTQRPSRAEITGDTSHGTAVPMYPPLALEVRDGHYLFNAKSSVLWLPEKQLWLYAQEIEVAPDSVALPLNWSAEGPGLIGSAELMRKGGVLSNVMDIPSPPQRVRSTIYYGWGRQIPFDVYVPMLR